MDIAQRGEAAFRRAYVEVIHSCTYQQITSRNATIKRMGKIDPKKTYDLSNIIALGVFPIKNIQTLRRLVIRDLWDGENLLKTKIIGFGRGKRYEIKGKDINRYLARYGKGLALMQPKRIK